MSKIVEPMRGAAPRVDWQTVQRLRNLAEDHAEEVQESHWSPRWEELPVDATVVAERMGANVFWADLDEDGLDGFIYMPKGQTPEITINQKRHAKRRRFTTAHEAGHMMYARRVAAPSNTGFVDGDDTVSDEALKGEVKERGEEARLGTSEEEIYANAFAAALLMPRRTVERLHSTGTSVGRMARMFNVSDIAMTYRLENLGLSA